MATFVVLSSDAGDGYYYSFSNLLRHPDERDAAKDVEKAKADDLECWALFRGIALPTDWQEWFAARLEELNGTRPELPEDCYGWGVIAALLSVGYEFVPHTEHRL